MILRTGDGDVDLPGRPRPARRHCRSPRAPCRSAPTGRGQRSPSTAASSRWIRLAATARRGRRPRTGADPGHPADPRGRAGRGDRRRAGPGRLEAPRPGSAELGGAGADRRPDEGEPDAELVQAQAARRGAEVAVQATGVRNGPTRMRCPVWPGAWASPADLLTSSGARWHGYRQGSDSGRHQPIHAGQPSDDLGDLPMGGWAGRTLVSTVARAVQICSLSLSLRHRGNGAELRRNRHVLSGRTGP